jgi:hypothetical protein
MPHSPAAGARNVPAAGLVLRAPSRIADLRGSTQRASAGVSRGPGAAGGWAGGHSLEKVVVGRVQLSGTSFISTRVTEHNSRPAARSSGGTALLAVACFRAPYSGDPFLRASGSMATVRYGAASRPRSRIGGLHDSAACFNRTGRSEQRSHQTGETPTRVKRDRDLPLAGTAVASGELSRSIELSLLPGGHAPKGESWRPVACRGWRPGTRPSGRGRRQAPSPDPGDGRSAPPSDDARRCPRVTLPGCEIPGAVPGPVLLAIH